VPLKCFFFSHQKSVFKVKKTFCNESNMHYFQCWKWCHQSSFICSIYFPDKMTEIIKKELDVKKFEISSTVEETCFVVIPEDEIKLENTEIQGMF